MKRNIRNNHSSVLRDYGPNPLTVNINKLSALNQNYRLALWTGNYLQVTLMSIKPGGDIGLEIHPETDQFIRIEKGTALVVMGDNKNNMKYRQRINSEYAIMIPAGTWHNIINTGRQELKLYSVYAPPHHPFGTVHTTKEDAKE